MGLAEIFMIAVGLSMDAFAVSLCKGLNMRTLNRRHATVTALFFGGFQGLMPLLGWFLGKQFEEYIVSIDHWVAFILLAFIGGKMIREARQKQEGCCPEESCLNLRELTMLAIATSIDALAVGITLAFLQVDILPAVMLIAIVTFVLSYSGVGLGHRFGLRYKSKAETAGGAILILMGLKILLEHLGVMA